jgi:hypothetical protein
MNRIATRTAIISYNNISRIVQVKILEGSDIELADALQNYEATKILTKNDNYLVLVDGRATLSISREARSFAAQPKNNGCIASAFVITSTANKLIGNFYINVNKPSVPTKIFSSEEMAIEWLGTFLYQTESVRKFSSAENI